MKLLVVSDSHGVTAPMLEWTARHRPDAVLHLGDHAADAEVLRAAYPTVPVYAVRGNCDGAGAPESRTLLLGGVRIFLTHGHRYRVKLGTDILAYAALEQEAAVALYGHTHCQSDEVRGGVRLINPGAADARYALLTVENGAVDAVLY